MTNIIPFQRRPRFDSFVNRITGYGTSRDHGQQFTWEMGGRRLSKAQLDDIYARDEIAWKIIDTLPENALRKGWHYPKLDEAKQSKIDKILKGCGLKRALSEALKQNAVHGALLYVPVDDGGSDEDPVNFDSIRSIGEIQSIERDYIHPENLKRSLRFTHYLLYLPDENGDDQYVRVHRSRVIRIPGCGASRDWLLSNDGWPPSRLERCVEPLIARCAAHGVIPNVMKDIIRDVIGLQGLNDLSINDCEADQAAFNDRMDAMFLAQSIMNKLVLDTNDTYTRQTTSMAGIPEVVRLTDNRLVAASGLPHTVLLGESPGSTLGEGGNSQDRDLSKATEAYQKDVLSPVLDDVFAFIAPLVGEEEIDYAFNPLDVPTHKERAEVFRIMSEAVSRLVDSGVLSQAEAITFCDGDQVLTTVKPDLDARAAMESAHAEVIEDLLSIPEPPPELNEVQPNGSQEEQPQQPQA